MKKNYYFLTVMIAFLLFGCGRSRKELTAEIIKSYAQAVKEEDENTMESIFPDIIYFDEYPKVDKIEIGGMKRKGDFVTAFCVLYYETGLGKKIEQEITFLVNTNTRAISDVSGFLTRKDRNRILENFLFLTFPDLKPLETDMDVIFVKNESKAWNRYKAYDYFAKKALAERSKVVLEIKSNKFTRYGILDYYNKVSINLSITNNSDFDVMYSYTDDNIDYTYTFTGYKKPSNKVYGSSGEFLLVPNQTIHQTMNFSGEYYSPLEKNSITIHPIIESAEAAIKIVDKYYDDSTKKLIISGDIENSEITFDYKILL